MYDLKNLSLIFELQDVILHERLAMFTPSVEAVNDSNTFLVSKPRKILEDGKFVNKVPWITGVLSEEGLLYALGKFCSISSSIVTLLCKLY